MPRALRAVALALVAVLGLTACGQLDGVHDPTTRVAFDDSDQAAGEASFDDGFEGFDEATEGATTDTSDPEAGEAAGGQTAAPGTAGSPGTTGGTGGSGAQTGGQSGGGGGGGGGGGDGQTGAQGGGRQPVRGQNRTGVTEDTIRVGSHAPVTGAAPLPSRSFELSADLYWRWLTEVKGETVLGRTNIEGVFRDDRYTPSTAIQVCRQLAQETFLFGGAGGTDQIQACGRFANAARVPYISAGVTEAGLEGLDWYFAATMTYRRQGGLLAQFVRSRFPGMKVAAVVTDTPNFDDAVQGWEQGVQQEGLDYFRTFRHPKGDTSWYNTIARELANAGVEVLYINTSPVDYIRFAQQANQQGYNPQYVGVGITMGLNPVLGNGCPHVDGGMFFSPFPGLDWARENVPDFFQASERFGTPQDDLSFAIWGQAQWLHQLFQRYGSIYGNDLTREDFRDMLERTSQQAQVFPPVAYSPENHFGGQAVHVLRADCGSEEYVTEATFASSF